MRMLRGLHHPTACALLWLAVGYTFGPAGERPLLVGLGTSNCVACIR
jgi:hypothetical protein